MTISISPGTANVVGRSLVSVSRDAAAGLAGASVAAALFLGAPILAPAPAQAACDNYQFEGGLLQLELDNGYTVQVPANGQTVGPGRVMAANLGRTLATFGDATGGISGRKIEFKVSYDEGPGSGDVSYFTGQVNDNGRASGNVNSGKLFAGRADTPWHTNRSLSCVAPAAAPPPPPPPPPPSPPPPDSKSLEGPLVSWDEVPVGGLTVHITDRSGSKSSQCTYKADGYERGFELKAGEPTNVVIFPAIRKFANWDVTVTCDNGTETRTSIFF